MISFVCVYKVGPKFSPAYVWNLKRAVEQHGNGEFRFVCLTDHPVLWQYDWTIPLERPDKQGWWCLPEKFRIQGPVMFTGLDTIILKSLSPFAEIARKCHENTVYMIHAFRFPNTFNRIFANGIMIWNTDLSWFYREYDYELATRYPLEQDYTSATLVQRGYDLKALQSHVDGVHSFKRTLLQKEPLPDTRIVLFHGKPAVHQIKNEWIRKEWNPNCAG